MKIVERIYDATTGETKDITRDATAEELLEIERAELKAIAEAAKSAEAAAAKAALLEKLGITEDEVKLLLA